MRHLNRAFLRVFLLSAPLMGAIGACSDSSDEEKQATDLSASCTINSDCKEPLVCAFGRCHAQCEESRDCPAGQRCVTGEADSAEEGLDPGVCQLPIEEKCDRDADCAEGQFCARDGECRNQCTDDDDCFQGLVCTPSGWCALDEELDGDDVPEAPTGSGGAPSGSGGVGGAGEPGGAGGAGDPGGAGGAPEAGGAGGAGGDPGEPTEGGAPGVDDCSVEDVGNDDRTSATPYEIGDEVTACLQSIDDVDFYEFTTPEEPAQGGWLVVHTRDVGTAGGYYLSLFSGADNARIRQFYGSQGSNGAIWIASAPGQLYRASVEPYSVIPPDYTFFAEYYPAEDPYEPNDTRGEAAPIEVDEVIEGYLLSGHTSSSAPTKDADWFEVELSAGSVTATLDQPEGAASYIYLYNSAGTQITNVYGANGMDLTLTREGLAIGTYYFSVEQYTAPLAEGQDTTAPAIELEPYVFQVMQD